MEKGGDLSGKRQMVAWLWALLMDALYSRAGSRRYGDTVVG